MHRSTNRILTTHTGSLPRPQGGGTAAGRDAEPGERAGANSRRGRRAVKYVVGKQVECGLDIVNDGEQGRTDYTCMS